MQVIEIDLRIEISIQVWNIRFDQVVKTYGFDQNINEPCVYKKVQDKVVVFLILYVDDILLIGNDVGVIYTIKKWLATQFEMKDLGEENYDAIRGP